MDSYKFSSILAIRDLPYMQGSPVHKAPHIHAGSTLKGVVYTTQPNGLEPVAYTASSLPLLTFIEKKIRFFSARKHGLVDAAMRCRSSDRTAVIALPGGIGTLDEVFEIMALIQLQRIGSLLPVPLLLMNYDSFYSNLLEFLDDCEKSGTVSKNEVSSLWTVCNNNSEALAFLAEFYGLPHAETGIK